MNLSSEKTEHYILLGSDQTALNQELVESINKSIDTYLEEESFSYFIVDLPLLEQADAAVLNNLKSLHEKLLEQQCLVLFRNENTEIFDAFSEHDLLIVPSLSEAVEFIYMDQLEKQFLTDSE